jgi:hypothetical protein
MPDSVLMPAPVNAIALLDVANTSAVFAIRSSILTPNFSHDIGTKIISQRNFVFQQSHRSYDYIAKTLYLRLSS